MVSCKISDLIKNLINEIKNENIKINNIEDLSKFNFMSSKIISCFIDDNKIDKLNYNFIIISIYNIINDGSTIIKNSLLNIKTISFTDKGYNYYENLGISVQGVDANKSIKEIYKQATLNNIKINITIRLENNNIINLEF
jgi:hypothetical protein